MCCFKVSRILSACKKLNDSKCRKSHKLQATISEPMLNSRLPDKCLLMLFCHEQVTSEETNTPKVWQHNLKIYKAMKNEQSITITTYSIQNESRPASHDMYSAIVEETANCLDQK